MRVFDQRTIDWIEADDDTIILHVGAAGHRVREPLAGIERRLDPTLFARLHRSTVVNIARIAEIQPFYHGDAYAILRDGTRLRVSRTYRARLERIVTGR